MVGRTGLGHKIAVLVAGILITVFVILFSKGLSLDPKSMSSPQVGQNAKAFQVSMLQGAEFVMPKPANTLELKDLLGSPVIINFWATWCSSCAEEAKELEAFWQAHKSKGMKILGIAIHDKAPDVLNFVKNAGKTYPIALDEEGRIALDYGVTGVPETVFIDGSGMVIHKETGPITRQILEENLAKISGQST